MDIDGRKRVVIENVTPSVNGGRFVLKRLEGDYVEVQADILCDGHDILDARILYKRENDDEWENSPMELQDNDRWVGSFHVTVVGYYVFTIEAWVDHFQSWQRGLLKRFAADQDVTIDLAEGVVLLQQAAKRVSPEISSLLIGQAEKISSSTGIAGAILLSNDKEITAVMKNNPDTSYATVFKPYKKICVERKKALFSTWYEFFPRSSGTGTEKSGTFRECERVLPYIASMGFDVLYFPPIHPIGLTNRKGRNNSVNALPQEPGSPWAIGAPDGGHKSIDPALGTMEQFIDLINAATSYDIEIALDIAFQCSPDHPYIKEHPLWFKYRPDGSIQFAENPPKRYEDIVPFNFETEEWPMLWEELKGVIEFWIEKGIRIFRVDNPHTKPLRFWEWVLYEIKKRYPDTVFLSEAFTRPKIMYYLAKAGFSQSYTYFTWRNTKQELTEYFTELTNSSIADFFRPNLWPITPDILPEYVQFGGIRALAVRLMLASMLSPSYGIYGPVFEHAITAAQYGKEEFLDSEKYEIRHWEFNSENYLCKLITMVNTIRKENAALQEFTNLTFCEIDNEYLISFIRSTSDCSNIILAVINLDPFNAQHGNLQIPLSELGIEKNRPYLLNDLLSKEKVLWSGELNSISVDPSVRPAYIFSIQTTIQSENNYDYF